MRTRGAIILAVFVPIGLAGCFTPRLLDTPYEEPFESQRRFVDEFEVPSHLGERWKPVSGWWRIKEGLLFQNLQRPSQLPGEFQVVYVDGLASGPYTVETRFRFITEGDQAAGILLRFQDQNNYYLLRIRHYARWQDNIDLTQYVSGERLEDLRRMDLTIKPGQWCALRAEDRGKEIVAYLDGNELFKYPTQDRPVGTVGLAVKTGKVAFESFSANLNQPAEEHSGLPDAQAGGIPRRVSRPPENKSSLPNHLAHPVPSKFTDKQTTAR